MISVFGENYHLNLTNIDKFVNLESGSGDTENQHISVTKYEMIKIMIDVVFSEQEDVDDKLGTKGAEKLNIPFRLAWNTLLRYKLIEKL
jgi:hypothetical protein